MMLLDGEGESPALFIHLFDGGRGMPQASDGCCRFFTRKANGSRCYVSHVHLIGIIVVGIVISSKTCVGWSNHAQHRPWQQSTANELLWRNKPERQICAESLPLSAQGDEEVEEDYDVISEDVDDDIPAAHTQLVEDEGPNDDEFDWVPDSIKARYYASAFPRYGIADPPNDPPTDQRKEQTNNGQEPTSFSSSRQRSFYSDEQEELIEALGGRELHVVTDDEDDDYFKKGKREIGFLGDFTLRDIAQDYSVPVCYLADVLATWGVPVPIDIENTRLGDMVTGEQVFAILEAIYTLDVGELQDRYSNLSLVNFCDEYEISLQDAFQMAVKKGWSLPLGIQTHLRVEQEDALIRKFAPDVY